MYIVFENENQATVLRNPYFGETLVDKGYLLTNMHGVTHPSQPNYIAMVAGDTLGVTGNANIDLPATTANVADLLEAKGVSWKTYQEGYVARATGANACNTAKTIGRYARKHNPFMSFTSISRNATRCAAHVVPAAQLDADAADAESTPLPQYMFYTPDLDHDGHDTSVSAAAAWLEGFLEPKLASSSAFRNTLFVVTYDETAEKDAVGPIYTVLVGAGVAARGARDRARYDHYSLLRTVQNLFGLDSLGRGDAAATAVPVGPRCAAA
ncbi:phosphoesterase [Zopfochytrium polystomum]|nr:phosphoesterase [Zopfochytrium polystomum]